tara:strand:- start:2302 stop:3141 length:840 start_codon:yes stop_codon:yes gene_type:complete
MKRVLVIGHGFVGSALETSFHEEVEKKIVDPKYNTKVQDFASFNPHLVFICVPTPSKSDGSIDTSILEKVTKECIDLYPKSIITIKSTCLPNILKDLQNLSKRVIHNPEFLTEKNAVDDFISSPFQIFGGNKENCVYVSDFLKNYTKCKFVESHYVSMEVASLIKYTINSFLAIKVVFFNQIKEIFETLELENEYENFTNGVRLDERIGSSHMKVPGPDGRVGFGGACFPKDTKAFVHFFNENKAHFSILEDAIKVNDKIRKSYIQMLDREKEQNIDFQ